MTILVCFLTDPSFPVTPKRCSCVCLKHQFPLLSFPPAVTFLSVPPTVSEHTYLDITLEEQKLSPSADADGGSALLTRHSGAEPAEPHFPVVKTPSSAEICYQTRMFYHPKIKKHLLFWLYKPPIFSIFI